MPAGRRAPLVVFVPQYLGGPNQWTPLVVAMHDAGFASFRFDLRNFGELDERIDARDVRAAVRALRSRVDASAIAVVGSGVGGSTASWLAGMPPRMPGLRAAVAISPVDGPRMLRAAARGRFHPRDELVVIGRRDQRRFIAHTGDVRFRAVPSRRVGAALLRDPRVRELVVSWVRARVTFRARRGSSR